MYRLYGLRLIYGLIVLFSMVSTGLCVEAVKEGDSREQVLATLGPPQGKMIVRGEEILSYPRGEVILKQGIVTSVMLMSVETLNKQKARQEHAEQNRRAEEERQRQIEATVPKAPTRKSHTSQSETPSDSFVTPPLSGSCWSCVETFSEPGNSKKLTTGTSVSIWPTEDCVYQVMAQTNKSGSSAELPIRLHWRKTNPNEQISDVRVIYYYSVPGTITYRNSKTKSKTVDAVRVRAVSRGEFIALQKNSGEITMTMTAEDITGQFDVLCFAVAGNVNFSLWANKPISNLLIVKVNIAMGP